MDSILEDIKSSFITKNPEKHNCNKSKKFKKDLLCINEELEYKEKDSSDFKLSNSYKTETTFFKNIYIDEFQHKGKKSVDLLTLSKFEDENKGRFYFIEVKSSLVCYRWDEIKLKLIDTINKIKDTISQDNFISNTIVIGNLCKESEEKSAITNKIKKDIEDIEFLDIPLGRVSIYKPNSTINKELE